MLYLREDIKKHWQGKNPQELLENLEGEVYRALEARRTFRFEIDGNGFFAKVHGGIGWKEIFGNLVRFRLPVLGARNEWQALNKLRELGISTMTPVAFGETGKNPATLRSFLVTEELKDMVTLEDYCESWKVAPPEPRLKFALIKRLAEISRQMHDSGMNHCDYYLCHFMMSARVVPDPENLSLFMIDLHRARIRSILPERWRVKDLAGLYYSAMDYGITRRDIYRFLTVYTGLPLRDVFSRYNKMLEKIEEKAVALYKRMERKKGQPGY